VRPHQIGSVALIKEAAKRFKADAEDIAEFELKTQFRCSGSDAITPKGMLAGQHQEIQADRGRKLEAAKEQRKNPR